ncbi:MAG TPA: GerMN domain-containing protein [Oscillatoriaceae cyanobacterium]
MRPSALTPRWPAIAASLLAVLAVGVGVYYWVGNRAPARNVELYYADPQGMFLVPVDRPLTLPQAPAEWAQAVVAALRTPPRKGLVSPVTPDVKLLEASYAAPDWQLKVQVGENFGTTSERLVAGSLVRSFLASYPGSKEVTLRLVGASGQEFEGQHLDLSEPFHDADFVNTLDEAPSGGLNATVWWALPDGGTLAPIQVTLAHGSGVPPRDALASWTAGPPAASRLFLASVLPPGQSVHWAGLQAGVARVELAKAPRDDAPDRRFVEAALLTLTGEPGVTAVQFLHGGKPLSGAVGPYQLSAPLKRPQAVNSPTGDAS